MVVQAATEEIIDGWLHAYFEQGMEGYVEWAIYNQAFGGTANEGWDQAGIVSLEDGDVMTIFGSDGLPVWTGTIQKTSAEPGYTYDHNGNVRLIKAIWNNSSYWPCCDWMPRGADGALWTNWFYHTPPLAARVVRPIKLDGETQLIVLRRITSDPETFIFYPDYLVTLLVQRGAGILEGETNSKGALTEIHFRNEFGVNEVVWRCPSYKFQPLLVRFADYLHLEGAERHCSHTFFQCRFDDEPYALGAKFSLFMSNMGISGHWLRLCQYGIKSKPKIFG